MSDIKWIKIVTDIFSNRKIKQIECLPDGDAIIVIWVKLLCLAGEINEQGYLYMTKEIPYTEEMMSVQFDRPLNTVKLALKTFEQFGMIEIIDDVFKVANWGKYQSIDGMEKVKKQTKERVARCRERKKLEDVTLRNVTCNATVTECNATELDIDKERDIDKEKEVEIKDKKHSYGEYKHVKLTDRDMELLNNDYEDDVVSRAIKILDEYIEYKGAKYKNHYLVMKKWVIQRAKEELHQNDGFIDWDKI